MLPNQNQAFNSNLNQIQNELEIKTPYLKNQQIINSYLRMISPELFSSNREGEFRERFLAGLSRINPNQNNPNPNQNRWTHSDSESIYCQKAQKLDESNLRFTPILPSWDVRK
jgi:hypothetical protein